MRVSVPSLSPPVPPKTTPSSAVGWQSGGKSPFRCARQIADAWLDDDAPDDAPEMRMSLVATNHLAALSAGRGDVFQTRSRVSQNRRRPGRGWGPAEAAMHSARIATPEGVTT